MPCSSVMPEAPSLRSQIATSNARPMRRSLPPACRSRKFEQCFGGFGREMRRQREKTVFVGGTDIGQPIRGHTD
jgi:hypothetical protein